MVVPVGRLVRLLVEPKTLGVIAFRYACFVAMLGMALVAEARPAPSLPDAVLAHVPYVPAVARYNYFIWVVAYVPVALTLLTRDTSRFRRYMITAGILTLLRGVTILATGMGPVRGPDVNAGIDAATRWKGLWEILLMRGVLTQNSPLIYLTKDLFFSGHTATTCLLLLYVWRWPALRWVTLAAHVGVVTSVYLAHLHYTIDILGAYAVALALFAWREGGLAHALGGDTTLPRGNCA